MISSIAQTKEEVNVRYFIDVKQQACSIRGEYFISLTESSCKTKTVL